MNIPELLAPAGNHEKLVTAVHYGADAVYMGLSGFSLRAKADNFTEEALRQAVAYVRSSGKKVYITINIFPHNRDIHLITDHLKLLNEISPDALIISDPGVFEIATEIATGVPIHVSTQANITNYSAARFWEKMGAKRLVLARELSIEEIKEIRDHVSLELECFVHGSMCISYSGRCYMSSFLNNRSGNRGECTNTCRWTYRLMEESRPGEFFPVYENDRGTYVMSSRDLCMIEHLDKLADAGVNSFKIEGRMKGINYVAGVVKTYREAVDSLNERPFKIKDHWMQELSMSSNRGYTTGMFFGRQDDSGYSHNDNRAYRMSHELVGVVLSVSEDKTFVSLRNNLNKGDKVEFLSAGLENRTFSVTEMHDEAGQPVDSGRNENIVSIPSIPGVREHDLIRRPLGKSKDEPHIPQRLK
ncbi:MAG: U32 family peptidase [Nitrospiraceae bacterium]|nr:MAG: U32 family peptidase [Nitrospiraceae bacterium]